MRKRFHLKIKRRSGYTGKHQDTRWFELLGGTGLRGKTSFPPGWMLGLASLPYHSENQSHRADNGTRDLTLHKLGEAGDGNGVLGDQRRSSEWSRQAGCSWLGVQ